MPPESRFAQLVERFSSSRGKVIAGYAGFSLFAFVFWLYVTFPYQAVRDRVSAEAATAGWTVSIGSLGPGFLGVTARDVKLKPEAPAPPPPSDASVGQPGAARPSPEITLRSVSARPALFPPGLAVRASALGGNVGGSVGLLGDLKVRASAELDASDPSLKAALGVDASGELEGDLSLSIPRETGPARAGGFDLSKATGLVSLKGTKLLVKGGTVTVPMYGQMTPMDLPRVALGELDGRIRFDKGAGKLDGVRAKSEDLELQLGGTVTLGKRIDFSELNLELKVKTEPELNKRLGLVASALSVLPPDRTDPSFRATTITGYLGNPRLPGLGR